MAERRMFAKTIIDSDAFLDMPLSTQALYFHLSMRADDEGFLNNSKKIMRTIGANQNDYDVLMSKRFILQFDDGICVIKHWRIHNWIRGDRKKETIYQKERDMLTIKDNGSYTLVDTCQSNDSQLVVQMDTQVRLGKDRLGKVNKKNSSHFVPPTLEEVKAYCIERNNKVDADRFIDFYSSKGWMVGKNKMKDWKACIRTWEKDSKDNGSAKPKTTNKFNQFPQRDYSAADYSSMEQKLLSKG